MLIHYTLLLSLALVNCLPFPCATPSTVDPVPTATAPIYPSTSVAFPGGTFITGHWSEKAILLRPSFSTPVAVPVTSNCPHTQTGLSNWHNPATWPGNIVPANGSSVVIPNNTKVLISSCSIDPTFVFGVITIPVNSSLIFADADITISAIGFSVAGSLRIGSPTCRLVSKITITLFGSRNAQALPAPPTTKGISVTGTLSIHGALYVPTWTRLAKTANPGDTTIYVQDLVNWEPNQTIVITTTERKDSRDWHRNEELLIASVSLVIGLPNVSAIQLRTPLSYKHYGGSEYQAEVALLSRRIKIQGDPFNSEPTDIEPKSCNDTSTKSTYPCNNSSLTGFGAHIFMTTSTVVGILEGVELYRVGQTNVLGRYPIHYHLVGNSAGTSQTRVSDCSIHRSFFRCVAIHGTHNVNVSQNTAYDIIGHCYFLEDAIEENNTIAYNFGAFAHPLGPVQQISQTNGMYGQTAPEIAESPTLIHPSDLATGIFYITNPYNLIYGNAASGGWTGFSFPNIQKALRLSRNTTIVPMNRPLLLFKGNSAHSSGHWWASAGGVYVGGNLYEDANNNYTFRYTFGRSISRDSCAVYVPIGGYCSNAAKVWLRFEDTKVFLSYRGIQNWGDREEVIRFEGHDLQLSANVFGDVWVDDMLHNCRSNNTVVYYNGCPGGTSLTALPWNNCNRRDFDHHFQMVGFQFYDTGMHHIITNSTFRNCNPTAGQCVGQCTSYVFELLTHSDQYVPNHMQTTRNLKYQNCDMNNTWRFTSQIQSVSGKLQSWVDDDGSAYQLVKNNQRTLLGSKRSAEWYKINPQCLTGRNEMWICTMNAADTLASVTVNFDLSGAQSRVGGTICGNGNNISCPVVGEAIHFGRNRTKGLAIGSNPVVTGPLIGQSPGWFIEFKQNNTLGTPKFLKLDKMQHTYNASFIVAFPYPTGTTFTFIKAVAASWCSWSWGTCEQNFTAVTSVQAVRSGAGDKYFFNATSGILYIKVTRTPDEGNFKPITVNGSWTFPPASSYTFFTRAGISIPYNPYFQSIQIQASCPGSVGLYCPYVARTIPL